MNGNVYSMAVGVVAVGINVIIGRLTTARDPILPSLLLLLLLASPSIIIKPCRCRCAAFIRWGGKKERKGINTFRFVSFFQGNYRGGGGGGDVLDQPVFRLATSSRAPL